MFVISSATSENLCDVRSRVKQALTSPGYVDHAVSGRLGGPLRERMFRAFWLASLASNLGTWMHVVAVSWLMTSLTASAALVALIQTAMSLPAFALALPAGALADVMDRRRLIVATQGWQLLTATAFAVLALTDSATPSLLLVLTLVLAIGTALGLPVFWAAIPELVKPDELPAGVSLNSASFTLAQALGPTLGGLLVASAGPSAVFVLNALSFAAVVAVALSWRRAPAVRALPPEHLSAAIRTGVRYAVNSPPLKVILARAAGHVLCFSALPALLVLVARTELDAGAAAFGVLYGAFGAGGVAGALLLPRGRSRIGTDRLVLTGALALGIGLAALATVHSVAALVPLMIVAGTGSMAVLSSLNVAAQSVLPAWVRGRGLSLHLLMVSAGLAVGGALWGALASTAGLSTALLIAAGGVVLLHLVSVAAGLRLGVADEVDLTPTHWSEPELALEPDPDDGPIRIEIEYRIAGRDRPEFLRLMRDVRRSRKRDGAMRWALFQDLSDPERHVESFLVASWAEHERQPERALKSDRVAIERVLELHRGPAPQAEHLLGRDIPRFGRAR
jgi:MFS family permease